MDYGVSHGVTVYDDWEYYNRSEHRRYAYCRDCGEGEYEYDWHDTREEYEQYTSTQHRVVDYCSTCDSNVGTATYESHCFSYGSWQNYNGTQHRRTKTCRDCGYSSYDYANPQLFCYGSWTNSSRHTQHTAHENVLHLSGIRPTSTPTTRTRTATASATAAPRS